MIKLNKDISTDLNNNKFSFVKGTDFSLSGNFQDFVSITKTWENMEGDAYYGNKGKANRFRRYSDFQYNPVTDVLSQLDHRAYFQSEGMNEYVGGKKRHFEDFSDSVINSAVLRSLVKQDFDIYKQTLPEQDRDDIWQCQIHQIRIEVDAGKETEITPEGIHSDGYPFSAVHFWGKENISGAESKLYTSERKEILSLTFENILDTIYFFDRDMLHYVTPATTENKSQNGYRQIIAVSFSNPGTNYDIIK